MEINVDLIKQEIRAIRATLDELVLKYQALVNITNLKDEEIQRLRAQVERLKR